MVPLEPRWLKLNFDGLAKLNSSQVGGAGVIRDHKGKLILAYAVNLGVQSSNFAEVAMNFHGIQIAMKVGLSNLVIEGD